MDSTGTTTKCLLPDFEDYVGTYAPGCSPLTPEASFRSGKIRSHFGVRVAQPDGYRAVTLDLHVPAHASGPVRPVIFASGGGFRINNPLTGPWTDLVAAGFAVACVTYRLSSELHHPGPAADIKAAVRWLRAHGTQLGIEAHKVGAFGLSAGGYLVSFAALNPELAPEDALLACHPEESSRIDAVAVMYPPSDFLQLAADNAHGAMEVPGQTGSSEVRYLGYIPEDAPERNTESALAQMLGPEAPPFFLAHGTADRRVHISQSESFADALSNHGKLVDFVKVEGADHAGPEFSKPELMAQVTDFLRRELGRIENDQIQ